MKYYSDVIKGAMVSQITNLTIVYIQGKIKENIKAPRHWPLCGEFPAQMASNEKMFPFEDVTINACIPAFQK